jgi:CheY-like chemotaxis protein
MCTMKPEGRATAPPWQISGVRAVQRILVVDDDPDSAEMVAEMLAGLGFQSEFALNGPSAIALAKVFLPQVILLDVGLPEMDGYEVARQLRREASIAPVKLVAVTGWSGPERELKAREAGFDHYIVKPIQLSALKPILDG